MFKIKLMPQDKKFFKLFNDISAVVVEISDQFINFLNNYDQKEAYIAKITALEQKGNEISHSLMRELLSTFVTPMDREDIHSLVKLLTNIVNYIHSATIYVDLYNIDKVTPQAVELATILKECTKEVELLISKLDNMSELEKISTHVNKIRDLEETGDLVFRKAIKELFLNPTDPLYVLKWKDIYNRIENAIDKCHDSGNVILGIILKYA